MGSANTTIASSEKGRADGPSVIGLKYNDIHYTYNNKLGVGANGIVFSFTNPTDQDGVVVKLMTSAVNINRRTSMQIVCNTCCVRSTVLHDGYVEVMDRMDGDLAEYIQKYNPGLDEIAQILQMVRNQLACIDRACGAYTDIKCENVLYRLRDNVLQVHLGDIDSIVEKPLTSFPSSYPLPCSRKEVMGVTCEDMDMVNYLTKLLYIDIMTKYSIKRGNKEMLLMLKGLFPDSAAICTTDAQWQVIEKTLSNTKAYQMVTSAQDDDEGTPSLFEQKYPESDTYECRHCMSMDDLSLRTCPGSKTCTVRAASSSNYVYYRQPKNKLTRITKADNTYELKFQNVGVISISGQ